MYDPAAPDTSGYPSLTANVGSVYGATPTIPSGNLATPPGNVVFGLNSVSEPNTSPDVITVSARLHDGDFPKSLDKYVLPSGTPVAIVDNGNDRHGDATHTIYMLTQRSDCTAPLLALNDGMRVQRKVPFITVSVGEATFVKRSRDPTYVAIAVQNVATVSLAGVYEGTSNTERLRGVCLGDRLYLNLRAGSNPDQLPITTEQPRQNHVYRALRVVAPVIGATVRCDFGLQHSSP